MDQRQEITVFLADDQAIVLEGIATLCKSHGLRILGQCSDGTKAVEMITSLKPDFAILDLQMPGLPGVETIRKLRQSECTAKFMIFSISRDENAVTEALRAGADAYLLKDGPSRHLLDAINFVRDGGIYISPLLRAAGIFAKPGKAQVEDPVSSLSPKEMEVFSYLVNGLRAKDIADLLETSPKTVDTYRASLMRKLRVHDLVALVKPAQRPLNLALLEPDERKVYFLLTSGVQSNEIVKRMKISSEEFYTLRFRVMRKLNIQNFDTCPPELG